MNLADTSANLSCNIVVVCPLPVRSIIGKPSKVYKFPFLNLYFFLGGIRKVLKKKITS